MRSLTRNNQDFFLQLLKTGLWADVESTDILNQGVTESVNWEEMYQLAEEQSVVGLVLAGIEHSYVKPPQELLLQWIGEVQILEQQNKAMNNFVAQLNKRLWQNKIYGLLVKGQGVAQCYEKPQWRACGDIDLLMDDNNYEKAKDLLIPLADEVQGEEIWKKHQTLIIKDFDIELHGKMPFGLSHNADKVLDEVIDDVLKRGCARVWTHNNSDIYLPNADNDVIIIFTHLLRHFFIEGVGLRQICDWCRLLYRYSSELDIRLLESRIKKAGLMSEWKAFAALAVVYLGMPVEVMPFYDARFKVKGERVLERILKCGNFGHNHDLSYRAKYSGMTYKLVALWRRINDFAGFTRIFPIDAPKFFVHYVFRKI